MKLVTNKFKSGGLHEKHVVVTWNELVRALVECIFYLRLNICYWNSDVALEAS